MLEPATSQRARFGPFELDLRSGELTNNGRRQTLPEQPLALLEGAARPTRRGSSRPCRGEAIGSWRPWRAIGSPLLWWACRNLSLLPCPRLGREVGGGGIGGPVRCGRNHRWCMVGVSQSAHRERGCAKRRTRAAQPDTPDVRSQPADGCNLVPRWPLHRVRLRQGWQLRHLGAARHGRRRGTGHEIAGAGHGARLVTGRQHDRVPIGTRWRRPLRRAVAWRTRAPPDVVRRAAEMVTGRIPRYCLHRREEIL